MEHLKKVFEFYIYSNFHVSIAAFCLTKLTLLRYNVNENTIPFFVFFATITSYNFIRFYNINTIQPLISVWIKTHKKLLISLNFISVVFLLKLSLDLNSKSYIILIPMALSTFFYSVPFLFQRKNLRSMTNLKLFLIIITWAGVTVLLPLKNAEIQFSNDVWLIFIQRVLFLFAIIIPFDIRDLDFDNPEIKTLPQTLGVKKSKIIGVVALFLFFMIELVRGLKTESTLLTTILIAVISMLFLIFSNKKQNQFYSSFWVESLPIVWFLLMFFITG